MIYYDESGKKLVDPGIEDRLEDEFYELIEKRKEYARQWENSEIPARSVLMNSIIEIHIRIKNIFKKLLENDFTLSEKMQNFKEYDFPKDLKDDIIFYPEKELKQRKKDKQIEPTSSHQINNLFKPGTSLAKITISFEDAYIVKIKGPGFSKKFVYTELGFASKHEPSTLNRLGNLLDYFAKNDGVISLSYIKGKLHNISDNAIHTSVKRLRKRLKIILGIAENPIRVIDRYYHILIKVQDNRTLYRDTDQYKKARKSTGTPSKDALKHIPDSNKYDLDAFSANNDDTDPHGPDPNDPDPNDPDPND